MTTPERFRLGKYGVTREQWLDALSRGERWCSGCKKFESSDNFRGGQTRCRVSQNSYLNARYKKDVEREESRKKYWANPQKARDYQKKLRSSWTPEQRKLKHRINKLSWKYRITLEQYDAMVAEQGNLCAICGRPQRRANRPLCIDHDHKTGKVRGLLCDFCNQLLGFLENHRDRIPAFEAYLKKF